MQAPWDRVKINSKEYDHQVALFQWAAMAALFGFQAATDAKCYTEAGYAKSQYGWPEAGGDTVLGGPNGVPDLDLLHAIHNQGTGDKIRGARSRAEGIKPGIPDMFLPVPKLARDLDGTIWREYGTPFPNDNYGFGVICGLYIELKRQNGGKTSDDQDKVIVKLKSKGYLVAVCHGWADAATVIKLYLESGK